MTQSTANAPSIKIEGYLTESKLSAALQQIVPGWMGDQVCVPGTRQRWDMAYRIDSIVIAVEYEGDEHYRHSIKIKGDRAKDEIARKQGYRIVRFPYWIQLDALPDEKGTETDARQVRVLGVKPPRAAPR